MNTNKSCCIVIPIYKNVLSKFERESLMRCVNVLGNKYDIYLVHSKSLNIEYYYNIVKNYYFFDIEFTDSFFKSKETYSSLCTTTSFYYKFKHYNYMLIYQLDGWVFYDNLEYFINLGYDWIGSPWIIEEKEGVGNGGVSLRNIKKMIYVTRKYGKTTNFEDQYFCIEHAEELNICDITNALKFGLCSDSHNKYFYDDFPCPMFAHQIYNQNHFKYWQKRIIFSDGTQLPEKHNVRFNTNSLTYENYAAKIYSILNHGK